MSRASANAYNGAIKTFLIIAVAALTLGGTAHATELEKLAMSDPLSLPRALHAAEQAGYGEVFGYDRLGPRTLRLRVCGGWYDLYDSEDRYVGQFCGWTEPLLVRLRHGRVWVVRNHQTLPKPDPAPS